MDRDLLYIIHRERFSKTLGPFDNPHAKYGRLSRDDLKAELSKLWSYGLVEEIKDDGAAGRYKWTNFGYAVLGAIGTTITAHSLGSWRILRTAR